METTIRTIRELEAEAKRFAHELVPQQKGATLVTLTGELGAGKTAFVQATAKALGVVDAVTSPTFVLEKIYTFGHPMSEFKRLVHIDAYRLEREKDLGPLRFDELMRDRENLIMLEWPERVGLDTGDVAIALRINTDSSRTITYG